MIDENFHAKKEEKKVYPPLPKNVYQVQLLAVDLKDAKGRFSKPGDKNLAFQFTLLAGKDKDGDLRGRNVWDNFVPTTLYVGKNGKNALWQIVEAFLGRELTLEEEAMGVSGKMINSFIGKQIRIFVDHKIDGDKIYNRITSYMPVEHKLEALSAQEVEDATVKNKPAEKQEETISYDEDLLVAEELGGHVEDEANQAMEEKLNQIPF